MEESGNIETKWPSTPWDLLRLAISDLEKCEADPLYKIDMDIWHEYDKHRNVCLVCLAGSVWAKTMGTDHLMPFRDFKLFPTSKHIGAIDDFRTGDITSGLNKFDLDLCHREEKAKIVQYRTDREIFKLQMLILAEYLESEYGD